MKKFPLLKTMVSTGPPGKHAVQLRKRMENANPSTVTGLSGDMHTWETQNFFGTSVMEKV